MRFLVTTKSTLGVGVLVGSGVAVGGRGVAVLVGGSAVGVSDGCGVEVGGTVVGVDVGGTGVGVNVGGSGVGVAVSAGVAVLVALGNRVAVGSGVGVAAGPQPTRRTPDNTIPTATGTMRFSAQTERWDSMDDGFSLTRITFPLRTIWDIMLSGRSRRELSGAEGRIRTDTG
jgi:hypothetical protein